ncbi:MAG: copper amine oxidase N-terminal domain-containing protein [Clostridiales bacterium]|jgi:hypothetical protein|nr:copper amine oxidase N-terminal domain-containing protein [Clostridiales bacterium]
MKKFLTIFIIFIYFIIGHTEVSAKENINSDKIYTTIVTSSSEGNNTYLNFKLLESEVSPYIFNGVIMIPLRAFAEAFGYSVNYQTKNKRIIIRKEGEENEFIFSLGSLSASVDGLDYDMNQAPIIHNDRVFISVNYVSCFFNKYITLRENINRREIFLWISSIQFLSEEDVAVEKDDNYYNGASSMDPMAYYYLKSSGQTNRGVKIGDRYEKVVELYGEPHVKEIKNEALYTISYYTAFLPGTGSGSIIYFSFVSDILTSVGVDGRPF